MRLKKQIVSFSRIRPLIVVLLLLGLIFLTSCTRELFDQEADDAFSRMVGPNLNRRALIITTDKLRYKRGEDPHFWIENRTGKSLWFPDQQFGVNAFTYDDEAKTWLTVDLGVIPSPFKQPELIPPGVSGPFGLSVGARIQPGPVRLLFVGSTDPNAPGVGGEVYATYVDVIFEEEIEEP